MIAFHKWEEWVNAALAAWLIVSPYLMGFSALTYALWNQLIVGMLVSTLFIGMRLYRRLQGLPRNPDVDA